MVVQPVGDGDLSRFLQLLSITHTQRHHARTHTVGYGHLYQGRYKSFPVEGDRHFLTLVRYVERNAQRAARVNGQRIGPGRVRTSASYGSPEQKKRLSPWPVPEPLGYRQWLNQSQPREEMEKIRKAMQRSRPYGSEKWVGRTVAKFGLENTLRNPGRPKGQNKRS